MAGTGAQRLLRDPRQARGVSSVELFFDLAIIAALVQFAQRLLRDFGWANSLQTVVLLAAVWWVWVGAARTTDWLDPDKPYPQRIIIGTMVAALLLAAAVPQAFGQHGFVFAGAYVAAHLVRHLAVIRALRGHPFGARSVRAAIWFLTTGTLWITGAALPAAPRLVLWAVALFLDYLGVGLGWRIPRLPPLPEQHLRIAGGHIAERHRQILVIAVGELVLRSGISLSHTGLDIVRVSAFAVAFAIAGLIAWTYFLPHGIALDQVLDRRPAVAAVNASYTHLVMILGIVVTAMSAEIVISRPLGEVSTPWSVAILAGPFLYLGGRSLHAWIVFERASWQPPAGMLVIAAMSPAMLRLPPLPVAGAVGLVLLGVLLGLQRSGHAPTRPGSGQERLLRQRENPRQISPYELFFDLAMIFALTRVSQRIADHLSLINTAQSLILMAGVYWIWVATAWSTDWFNPDAPLLQRLIIGIMFAGLLMASAVPTAFGRHGLLFAGAYAGIHIVRGLVIVPALRGSALQARSARVLVWFSISAGLWLAGAVLPTPDRIALWVAAVLVDGASAVLGWPVPGLNRRPQAHLRVTGEHIAERYREVLVISLGALVLLGTRAYSFAGLDYARTLAFLLVFTTTTLMLWIYFPPPGRNLDTVINKGGPRIAVIAAYCHGVMIAGTVVEAAAAEMYIRRPLGRPNAGLALLIVGGLALHIAGRTAYGALIYRYRRPWRGPVALVVLAAVTPGLVLAPPLVVAIAVVCLALCLSLSWRKATVNAGQPRD